MLHLAIRGVRNNVGRYVATILAIVTGVAFFAATGFIADGITRALEGDAGRQLGAVDVAVIPKASDAGFAEAPTITPAAAARIRAVDGVDASAGIVVGPVTFQRADGTTYAAGVTGRAWIADDALNPLEVVDGQAPTRVGHLAIDQGLADRESLSVGSKVTLLTTSGPHEATVVGITKFGSKDSIDEGGTVSMPEDAAFAWLRDGRVGYDSLYLRGSVDPTVLAQRVEQVVPAGFEAKSGPAYRADQKSAAGSFGRFLKIALQTFAALAMFVGGFVIYNTFSVIVAQRQRELAVLSAIGATPKQIKRSLRYEGLVIGLVGSVLGVLVGLLLAEGLLILVRVFGVGLPGGGIVVKTPNVINAIIIGTLITLFSVTIPARRAAKVEPIEALRESEAPGRGVSRRRGVIGAIFTIGGVAAMLLGTKPALIGVGALALIIGIIVAGPFIAIGGSAIFRRLLAGFGLDGRLAVDNSIRNPTRTATTANALLIGIFLVTFVTVAGTSLKDWTVQEIQKLQSADYLIQSDGGTIDDQLVAKLEDVDGVQKVTTYRRSAVIIDGKPSLLSTAETGDLVAVTGIKASAGSLDDLGPGKVAVTPVSTEVPKVGSTLQVTNLDGESQDLTVVAVLDPGIDSGNIGNLVDAATFDGLVGETAPTAAFIDAQEGAQSDTEDAIKEILSTRPDISLIVGNSLGKLVAGIFDFMIKAVNGLLLMSVVVALIGIVNTLSLSILERRRELGLLRIMGMTDKHVRRMVRLESALIAALGTITGIALGLLVGFGLIGSIDRLSDASISLSLPWGLLLVVLVLGVALGFVSSLLPSRRSTHMPVLEAIQAT